MAMTKTWAGTVDGDYTDVLNWALNSLRNSSYAWTASGSGTNEYYVRTAGGADPGFSGTPPTATGVYINGTAATKASLGSLATGEWGYGDNDTLGYSTVYVRLSDGTDPDTKVADYVQFRQIPGTGDHVRIPAGSGSISENLDQSAVAIGGFYVEKGYSGIIGSETSYLRIDPDAFEFDSLGLAYIDLHSANISAVVHGTTSPSVGGYGLSLRGSNLALLDARGGSIGIAPRSGELSTVATIRQNGSKATVYCGPGVTLTTAVLFDGVLRLSCGATTITEYGGKIYLQEAAAITTVNAINGEFFWGSSGNITTYNARGGTLDMRASNAARTLGTLNRYANGGRIIHNKEAVTITTNTMQDSFVETIGV